MKQPDSQPTLALVGMTRPIIFKRMYISRDDKFDESKDAEFGLHICGYCSYEESSPEDQFYTQIHLKPADKDSLNIPLEFEYLAFSYFKLNAKIENEPPDFDLISSTCASIMYGAIRQELVYSSNKIGLHPPFNLPLLNPKSLKLLPHESKEKKSTKKTKPKRKASPKQG